MRFFITALGHNRFVLGAIDLLGFKAPNKRNRFSKALLQLSNTSFSIVINRDINAC